MSFKSLSIVAAAAFALCGGVAHAQVAGLANGGFEAAANSAGEFADGWQSATGAVRSSAFAHSGTYSAFLTITNGDPGSSGFFQNSVDHGGLLAVDSANWGTAPTLSFWLKGNTSETGNVNYALRYLDSVGNILNGGSGGSAGAKIVMTGNTNQDWFQVTRTPNTVIPVNTSAVFLEMTLAAGPSGTFSGCGGTCNWGTPAVYVDDVSITLANPVAVVPEPESYALMLAGIAVIGATVHRRRRAA